MKTIKLIAITLLLLGCNNEKKSSIAKAGAVDIEQNSKINNQDLIIID